MKVNLLFFIIFASLGLIFLILSLIFRNKDKKMLEQCNQTIKGKVIKYTLWNNEGVHFPIVEYIVDNAKYEQRLKYGWIISKSSSFNKVKAEVENDVKSDNLVVRSNMHISTNPLQEQFPVGTEVDVYYNPQSPKKSYVMRFVKNPARKAFFIAGLSFIILAFVGLMFMPRM